nr:WD-40 repeat-containing protein MSI1 [Ipomoea batatas]
MSSIVNKYRKCNIPYPYNFIYSGKLKSLSLTIKWIPDVKNPEGEFYRVQKLILGTRSRETEQNRLLLIQTSCWHCYSTKYPTDGRSGKVYERMLNHQCRTMDSEEATRFFIPFYAGIAVGKFLFTEF